MQIPLGSGDLFGNVLDLAFLRLWGKANDRHERTRHQL
jgi:hypothetical protein